MAGGLFGRVYLDLDSAPSLEGLELQLGGDGKGAGLADSEVATPTPG